MMGPRSSRIFRFVFCRIELPTGSNPLAHGLLAGFAHTQIWDEFDHFQPLVIKFSKGLIVRCLLKIILDNNYQAECDLLRVIVPRFSRKNGESTIINFRCVQYLVQFILGDNVSGCLCTPL